MLHPSSSRRSLTRIAAPFNVALMVRGVPTVVAVNTCNYAGKKKRERTAAFGHQADWKKAIVTLKKGDKIELA